MDLDKLRKAGEITKKLKKEAVKFVEPGKSFLELAEYLEGEMRKQGAEPTFPVNISVNEVAAHYSPWPDDRTVFEEGDIVKVDFGVQIDGFPTDNSITVDLGEHDELVQAARDALDSAISVVLERGKEATLSEIGSAIESAIKSRGFLPITNLTGHQMTRWTLHAGRSIYNYDCGSDEPLGTGLFAIEPFATDGFGKIKDGARSSIFRILKPRPQRLPQLRKLMAEISRFRTFPFSARWVSQPSYLQLLVRQGVLHNYPLLVEINGGMVSQFEETVLITDDGVEVITR